MTRTDQIINALRRCSDRTGSGLTDAFHKYAAEEISKEIEKPPTSYCSFCGESQHEIEKLIAGPNVFICNECVELCMDIIRVESEPSPGEIEVASWYYNGWYNV